MKKRFSLLIFIISVIVFVGCNTNDSTVTENSSYTEQTEQTISQYAKKENWAYFENDIDKPADVFLICPTVDMGTNGNYNMSMTDEETKANFVGALNMERGIYDNKARLFSPYYKQVSFPVYSLNENEASKYFDFAYMDIKEAFEYYIKNVNNERPLILAGFSQGSDMVLRLMKDYFGDENLQKRLVAAYCIGWIVTEEDLSKYPWLKTAKEETDTGVIVSFNSEAEGISESLIIPKNKKSISINPLNWKTDNTPAKKEENLGACFTDYSASITKEEKNFTGAYIDSKRGSLIVTDVSPKDYSNSLFPDGVYHLYDYQFFYRNLQNNVDKRIDSYINKN